MRLSIFILLGNSLFAQTQYDLLLKGAQVIDPKNKRNSVQDVAIRDGLIAAVARDIPAKQARKAINVSGLYLVPGLIDLHSHVFAGSDGVGLAGGEASIFPDAFALRVGVTTVVDAGSSGRRNFAQFKKTVIDRARTRVLAFLNIGGVGMPGDPQEQNVADMDAKAAAELAIANRDTIVGIKVAHYRGPDWTPVERGVEAGAIANIPVSPPIIAHSIVAVRGAGDYHKGRDGLVTYTSAHQDYVKSEFIVRSYHTCLDNPATIEEVRRILHEHLEQQPPSATN